MSLTHSQISPHDLVTLLAAVAVLLTTATAAGAAARCAGQPAVLGEILAGLLLGPTLLGRLASLLFAIRRLLR